VKEVVFLYSIVHTFRVTFYPQYWVVI